MLARILLFCTIRDFITVLLLIAPDCSSTYLIYIWLGYILFFCHLNWFLDSHSWIKPTMIQLFYTMVDDQGHVCKFDLLFRYHWPIFDLHSVVDNCYQTLILDDLGLSVIGFQTHFWMKPSSILILGTWHILSTPDLGLFTNLLYLGHALRYVSHIVFWSFIA